MKELKFETEQQAASYVIGCEMKGRKYITTGRKSIMAFE